jgi:hypothetical protein
MQLSNFCEGPRDLVTGIKFWKSLEAIRLSDRVAEEKYVAHGKLLVISLVCVFGKQASGKRVLLAIKLQLRRHHFIKCNYCREHNDNHGVLLKEACAS